MANVLNSIFADCANIIRDYMYHPDKTELNQEIRIWVMDTGTYFVPCVQKCIHNDTIPKLRWMVVNAPGNDLSPKLKLFDLKPNSVIVSLREEHIRKIENELHEAIVRMFDN